MKNRILAFAVLAVSLLTIGWVYLGRNDTPGSREEATTSSNPQKISHPSDELRPVDNRTLVTVSVEVFTPPWIIYENGTKDRVPSVFAPETLAIIENKKKAFASQSWKDMVETYTAESQKALLHGPRSEKDRSRFETKLAARLAGSRQPYAATLFDCLTATSETRSVAWLHVVDMEFLDATDKAPATPFSYVLTLRKESGRWLNDHLAYSELDSVPTKLLLIPPSKLLGHLEDLKPFIAAEFNTSPDSVEFEIKTK